MAGESDEVASEAKVPKAGRERVLVGLETPDQSKSVSAETTPVYHVSPTQRPVRRVIREEAGSVIDAIDWFLS